MCLNGLICGVNRHFIEPMPQSLTPLFHMPSRAECSYTNMAELSPAAIVLEKCDETRREAVPGTGRIPRPFLPFPGLPASPEPPTPEWWRGGEVAR